MRPTAKLAAFAVVLAAALGAGAALGQAAGPLDVGGGPEHAAAPAAGALPAGGLLVAQDGYRLRTGDRVLPAGAPAPFAFTIDGPGGPVTGYQERHERELHLVVVSRDLATYRHLHPSRDGAGQWSIRLPALEPGPYRAFADFQPAGGPPLTLGVDLTVPGRLAPPADLAESRADAVDGYQVTLEGSLAAGGSSELAATVRRDGEVVATQPYLGAAGHLVAVRDGDLAYLHVHPLGGGPAGPVRFAVEAPSPGTYVLYFDFRHEGVVRTARFVVPATAGPAHEGMAHP